ncbi:hypothetical protein [Longitalea luteola]|uniref:hypothetical protein n=1 Tax=Longitalea luteola TaxID=2812563 RepID=UPI001A9564B3|nr:hypothetical protein [Longitalea luteola]
MKKTSFKLGTATNSTATLTLENKNAAEKLLPVNAQPTPPSEETIARLNAIAREYPFCAYIKQHNLFLL